MKSVSQARARDLLRRELTDILRREVQDPRAALASIADLTLSADRSHARILLSVLGDEDERKTAIRAVRRAAGFIRGRLGRRLRLRRTPELHFELYRGAEHAERIDQLLKDL
ncbi:MAG: 30S ribosome-binding factor RbfA [Acidobacteria bacterium]|nr:30S ribosome-binding factor RbfA [Acidobacteriota bacterium]